MKKLFLGAILTLTVSSVFAQTFVGSTLKGVDQSYASNTNGTVLITGSDGRLIPEAQGGLFLMPKSITHRGGNFFIDDNDLIRTLDTSAYYYSWPSYDTKGKVKVVGGNYFISSKNILHIVNNQGTLLSYNKDPMIVADEVKVAGGTFFFTKDKLIALDHKGFYYNRTRTDVKAEDVAIIGNNFFVTKAGIVYSVAVVENTDTKKDEAFVFDQKDLVEKKKLPLLKMDAPNAPGNVKAVGGNFIVLKTDEIITVSLFGNVENKGKLIYSKKVDDKEIVTSFVGKTPKVGGNYLVYTDSGAVITVDYAGITGLQEAKAASDIAYTNHPVTGIVKK